MATTTTYVLLLPSGLPEGVSYGPVEFNYEKGAVVDSLLHASLDYWRSRGECDSRTFTFYHISRPNVSALSEYISKYHSATAPVSELEAYLNSCLYSDDEEQGEFIPACSFCEQTPESFDDLVTFRAGKICNNCVGAVKTLVDARVDAC